GGSCHRRTVTPAVSGVAATAPRATLPERCGARRTTGRSPSATDCCRRLPAHRRSGGSRRRCRRAAVVKAPALPAVVERQGRRALLRGWHVRGASPLHGSRDGRIVIGTM